MFFDCEIKCEVCNTLLGYAPYMRDAYRCSKHNKKKFKKKFPFSDKELAAFKRKREIKEKAEAMKREKIKLHVAKLRKFLADAREAKLNDPR